MDELETVSLAEKALVEHLVNCDPCRETPIVFGLCDEGLALLQAAAEEDEKNMGRARHGRDGREDPKRRTGRGSLLLPAVRLLGPLGLRR